MNIVGELQSLSPGQNLLVSVVSILGAERRVSAQALEHDGAQGPPIAFVSVALREMVRQVQAMSVSNVH